MTPFSWHILFTDPLSHGCASNEWSLPSQSRSLGHSIFISLASEQQTVPGLHPQASCCLDLFSSSKRSYPDPGLLWVDDTKLCISSPNFSLLSLDLYTCISIVYSLSLLGGLITVPNLVCSVLSFHIHTHTHTPPPPKPTSPAFSAISVNYYSMLPVVRHNSLGHPHLYPFS